MKKPKFKDCYDVYEYSEEQEKYITQLEQMYREECDAHTRTLKRLEEK